MQMRIFGQNQCTNVNEIFGDPPLSGHYACSLDGPNRVDLIYDVTIASHQTLRSPPRACLAYIGQAKQIFIAPYAQAYLLANQYRCPYCSHSL